MFAQLPALVVSSDRSHGEFLMGHLKAQGYEASICSTVDEFKRLMKSEELQVVLCDRELDDGTYEDVLRHVKELGQEVPVIVTSRLGDWNQYFEAVERGAFDLVRSPCNVEEVARILSQLPRSEGRLAKATCLSAGA